MTLFGSQDLPSLPVKTRLWRNLVHVFNHGIKPEPVWSKVRPKEALTLDSVLPPGALFGGVFHPTSYFKSGLGIRPLTMDELGIAFGFPAWLRAGGLSPGHFPIVPVQVMDACLRAILTT
jgi:hypothetical protein